MRVLYLLLLMLWFALVSGAQASDSPRLDGYLASLESLEAEFTQLVESSDLSETRYASGVFMLRRPGLFRWEYRTPQEQLIVADGKKVWLYDPELEQVSFRSQEKALRGTPAELLSGSREVDADFLATELGAREGLEWVELLPRETEGEFERVLLGFGDGELQHMEMHDSLGQVTRFRFHHIQRNLTLDPSLFTFEPPQYTDILGE